MKKFKVGELIEDLDVYPRGGVDSQHASYIASALEAGSTVPPLVIEKKTKRIVDGVHRRRAYVSQFGEDYEVECIEKSYVNDGELFADAMRFNSGHGKTLSAADRARCLLLAEKFSLDLNIVGQALHMTATRIGELRATRISFGPHGEQAIKRTISHMAGTTLTPEQAEANEKLSGMSQVFYCNQLIALLQTGLVNNSSSMDEALRRLHTLIGTWLKGSKAA